ncbi:MAG: hypothetical protein U0798_17630 [Gemmataceae bacterium]
MKRPILCYDYLLVAVVKLVRSNVDNKPFDLEPGVALLAWPVPLVALVVEISSAVTDDLDLADL